MIENKAKRLLWLDLVKKIPKEGESVRDHFRVFRRMPINKYDRDVYYNPKTMRWSCEPCFWMDNFGTAKSQYCSHILACQTLEKQKLNDIKSFM